MIVIDRSNRSIDHRRRTDDRPTNGGDDVKGTRREQTTTHNTTATTGGENERTPIDTKKGGERRRRRRGRRTIGRGAPRSLAAAHLALGGRRLDGEHGARVALLGPLGRVVELLPVAPDVVLLALLGGLRLHLLRLGRRLDLLGLLAALARRRAVAVALERRRRPTGGDSRGRGSSQSLCDTPESANLERRHLGRGLFLLLLVLEDVARVERWWSFVGSLSEFP